VNALTRPDSKLVSQRISNALLRLHAIAFATWWWIMPGGFPISHLKTWSNSILPALGLIACVLALFAAWRGWVAVRAWLLMTLAWAWLYLAITARSEFPSSFRLLCAGPFAAAALIGSLVAVERRTHHIRLTPAFVATAMIAGFPGYIFARAQKAGPSGTKPSGAMFADAPEQENPGTASIVQLGDFIDIRPDTGTIEIANGAGVLTVSPLLTFWSRSPDACWTLLANSRDQAGPPRRLLGRGTVAGKVALRYADDGESIVRISTLGGAAIEARSTLPPAVWSHLNTFATLSYRGQNAVSVSFSPCPDHRIHAKPIRPGSERIAEFAYVDRDDVFRIVASRSEEKGPFIESAASPLGRDIPFFVTFFEGDRPIFRVMLKDWSAQCSRMLSPTAGWGVPENAIELLTSGPTTIDVLFTLAATSVGRGFESVGHAPGTYVNRILVERPPD
jgi:hypothetical protein